MRRLLALSFLLLLGCAPQQEAAARFTDADEAAIRQLLQDMSAAAVTDDFRHLGRFFTEDAVWMPEGQPSVVGRSAVEAWFTIRALEWDQQVVEVRGNGDLAYVYGTYTLDLDVEGFTPYAGKLLVVLRRQPDGSWLVSHHASSCSTECG